MLSKTTVDVASQLAASLTDRGVVLSVKGGESTPLSVMTNHLETGAPGLRRELTDAGISKLTQQFFEHNQSTGDTPASEERDELVSLIVKGQQAILTKVRQEIIPKCKEVKSLLDDVNRESHPDISVKAVKLPTFLDNDVFLSHIGDYPHQHKLKGQYRSFNLAFPATEQIIEWVANTKHFDNDAVTTWALECLTDEKIRYVFGTLFDFRKQFEYHEISYLRSTNMFMEANELLFAYFLTAYLRDNPQTPRDESVSLEEWEAALNDLHGLLGLRIYELLKIRQRYYKEGKLVLRYNNENVGKPYGHLHVFVNSDVFACWVENGGDVKALLGAGVFATGNTTIKDFEEHGEVLAGQWDRKHAVIRSQFQTEMLLRRRQDTELSITDTIKSDVTTRMKVREVLSRKNDKDFDDMWKVIFDVVCEVFYPNPIYRQFLDSMAYFGTKTTSSREAALLANIEVLSRWFRTMVTWDHFTPDVVKQPTTQEETTGKEIDA